jgi:hypothetical protein
LFLKKIFSFFQKFFDGDETRLCCSPSYRFSLYSRRADLYSAPPFLSLFAFVHAGNFTLLKEIAAKSKFPPSYRVNATVYDCGGACDVLRIEYLPKEKLYEARGGWD